MRTLDGRDWPILCDPQGVDATLIDAVIEHYVERLAHSTQAAAWLMHHGLDSEHAKALRLGVSDRTLGYRLPEANRKDGAILRSRLTELGAYRASGHEHLVGCLVVPVLSSTGAILTLYGAPLGRGREGLFVTGLPGGIFSPGPIGEGELVVVATIPEALVAIGTGRANVVAPGRPGGFSKADCKELVCSGARSAVIVGSSMEAVAQRLAGSGPACRTVETGAPLPIVLASATDRAAALDVLLAPPVVDGSEVVVAEDIVADEVGTGVVKEAGRASDSDGGGPQVSGDTGELHIAFRARRWRVRGAQSAKGPESLRVSLSVSEESTGRFHLDTLDLCQARGRAAFVEAAASELRVEQESLRRELGEVLFATERAVAAASSTESSGQMTPEEQSAALALLGSPGLVEQVVGDLCALGIVGEETNLLVAYLSTISRLSERPFGVAIQSSSSAGKSTLADAVLSLVPGEDLMSYSALTGQALYYLGAGDLAHKVLSVAEEQGAARASYALKLLVSEGRLSIASTGKDPVSGKLRTSTYDVAGPVALVFTTTATEIDAELQNRLVVLGVDEDQAQTRAIHLAQRKAATLDGLIAKLRRESIVTLHQNAQRLLESLAVVIPEAMSLSFPDHAIRHRRDHQKLLSLIVASALLHQHQRRIATVEVDGRVVRYIEASAHDVALGARLAEAVLHRGLDELAPQTRRLLAFATTYLGDKGKRDGRELDEVSFTRRELREALGWSEHQVRIGLARLVGLEYLVCVSGGPGRHHAYRLVEEPSQRSEPREPREGAREVREHGSPGHFDPRAGKTDHLVAERLAYRQDDEGDRDVHVGADRDPVHA